MNSTEKILTNDWRLYFVSADLVSIECASQRAKGSLYILFVKRTCGRLMKQKSECK